MMTPEEEIETYREALREAREVIAIYRIWFDGEEP